MTPASSQCQWRQCRGYRPCQARVIPSVARIYVLSIFLFSILVKWNVNIIILKSTWHCLHVTVGSEDSFKKRNLNYVTLETYAEVSNRVKRHTERQRTENSMKLSIANITQRRRWVKGKWLLSTGKMIPTPDNGYWALVKWYRHRIMGTEHWWNDTDTGKWVLSIG